VPQRQIFVMLASMSAALGRGWSKTDAWNRAHSQTFIVAQASKLERA